MKELNCLRKVFTYTYGSQYGINRAVSQSIKLAVHGEFPDFKLDFSKVYISDRILNVPIKFELNKLNPQTIRISWDSNYCPLNLKSANVSFVLLQPESKEVLWEQNGVSFNSEFTKLKIPVLWESKKLHIWFYVSPSDSYLTIQGLYLGSIE